MRIIHTMLAFALACLPLTSCATTQSADAAIARNLPKACQALEAAHLAFVAVSLSGTIKQSTINKEAAAYAGVRTICADPSNVTAANALILVATAYATVAIALKEARNER